AVSSCRSAANSASVANAATAMAGNDRRALARRAPARTARRSEDVDLGAKAGRRHQLAQILLAEADAAVRHVAAEEPLVERTVDEIAVAEVETVLAEHAGLEALVHVGRDRLAFLDESPVGLAPDRVLQDRDHLELTLRRVEHPGAFAVRLLEDASRS